MKSKNRLVKSLHKGSQKRYLYAELTACDYSNCVVLAALPRKPNEFPRAVHLDSCQSHHPRVLTNLRLLFPIGCRIRAEGSGDWAILFVQVGLKKGTFSAFYNRDYGVAFRIVAKYPSTSIFSFCSWTKAQAK